MNLTNFFERFKVSQRLLALALTAFVIFGAITVETLDSLGEVLHDERQAKTRASGRIGRIPACPLSVARSRGQAQP